MATFFHSAQKKEETCETSSNECAGEACRGALDGLLPEKAGGFTRRYKEAVHIVHCMSPAAREVMRAIAAVRERRRDVMLYRRWY